MKAAPVLRAMGASVALALAMFPGLAGAQLISPGKLSTVHADLEGVRACTRCHELRRAGIAPDLCMECHRPLGRRLEGGRGFHASLDDRQCGTCHKEHLGRTFDLLRFDTASFDHGRTGYRLEGRHQEAGCRDCHRGDRVETPDVRAFKGEHGALDRTFMGLPTECAACHLSDSPHGNELTDRPCGTCHGLDGWEGAEGFDHGTTSYPLTGRHRTVRCSGCHQAVTAASGKRTSVHFGGVPSARCSDCHEDPHSGAMRGACASCHSTAEWRKVDRRRVESGVDHSVTAFDLDGAHASARCSSCHDPEASAGLEGIRVRFKPGTERRSFPAPESDGCLACHQDLHAGAFAERDRGGSCDECHAQEAWLPAYLDVAWHNRETSFLLEGAHVTVPCSSCHTRRRDGGTEFVIGSPTCRQCHEVASPHGGQFEERACDACHTGTSFSIGLFDHDRTRFPLEGEHAGVGCGSCHGEEPGPGGSPMIRYRPLGTGCRYCHGDRR